MSVSGADMDDRLTIAVAGTFTTEPLEEPLDYWMRRLGISADIRFASYNQVFQQLLDPSSLMAGNRGGVNVVLIRLDDWRRQSQNPERSSKPLESSQVAKTVDELTMAVRLSAQRSGIPHLVVQCPDAPASRDDKRCETATPATEALLAAGLAELPGVHPVTASELMSLYPVAPYYDAVADAAGHIPFTRPGLVAIATIMARRIHAIRTPARKAIVLDCDQTLWQGICGEDGPDGIRMGESHRAIQEFMVAQHGAGMLLCVCSKNNPQDIRNVFERHPEMPLKSDHIVSWRVNWRNKPENLISLAQELQLDSGSFIFVDDSPQECAEMRDRLAQVLTLQIPAKASEMLPFLQHVWAFDHLNVTEEDRRRTSLYRQDVARQRFEQKSLTYGEFLASLELAVDISPMAAADAPRIAQLMSRTTQFNFTGIRRSESELTQLHASGQLDGFVVRVEDRFGDYGLVGAVLFTMERGTPRVDTFLLSCRALGRGIEHQMMAHLGQTLRAGGARWIDIPFRHTERNHPARCFLVAVAGEFESAGDETVSLRIRSDTAAEVRFRPDEIEPNRSRNRPPSKPQANDGRNGDSQSDLLNEIALHQCRVEQIIRDMDAGRVRAPGPQRRTGIIAPQTPIERALAEIWREVLAVDEVGIHDSFFDLGGHSLRVVQVLSRIYERFGIELSMQLFFDAPTIAQQAELVQAALVARMDQSELDRMVEELSQLTDKQVCALLETELVEIVEDER
jgi:FkbH-like protein